MEGNLFYSGSVDLNVITAKRILSQQNLHWCLAMWTHKSNHHSLYVHSSFWPHSSPSALPPSIHPLTQEVTAAMELEETRNDLVHFLILQRRNQPREGWSLGQMHSWRQSPCWELPLTALAPASTCCRSFPPLTAPTARPDGPFQPHPMPPLCCAGQICSQIHSPCFPSLSCLLLHLPLDTPEGSPCWEIPLGSEGLGCAHQAPLLCLPLKCWWVGKVWSSLTFSNSTWQTWMTHPLLSLHSASARRLTNLHTQSKHVPKTHFPTRHLHSVFDSFLQLNAIFITKSALPPLFLTLKDGAAPSVATRTEPGPCHLS